MVQAFLFACAFWSLAADAELKPDEQTWLHAQFGEDKTRRLLARFMEFEPDAFLSVFDESAATLADDEKEQVYPRLEAWLRSGPTAATPDVQAAMAALAARLRLDEEVRRLTASGEGAGVAASASEARAAAVTMAGEPRVFMGHEGEVNAVAFSGDGQLLVSGAEDGGVKLWDFKRGLEMRAWEGHEAGVTGVGLIAAGCGVLSCDRAGVVKLWSLRSGEMMREWKQPGGLTGLAINAEGTLLAAASHIGNVVVLDLRRRERPPRTFGESRRGAIQAVAFHPDGRSLWSGGEDKGVRVWDLATGAERRCLRGHKDGVTAVAVSPDGRYGLSGARDNTLRIWNAETGRGVRTLTGHQFSVMGCGFGPDGRWAVSASWDHTLKLWDTATGNCLFSMESETARFSCVAFHPQGTQVAGGGSDKRIYVMALAGGRAE